MSRELVLNRVNATPLGRVAINDPASQKIAGLWAIKNCSTAGAVTASDVATALAKPWCKGLSLRASWSTMWQNGGPADPQGLFAAARSMLRADQGLMFRWVSGTQTPADVLSGCRSYVPGATDPCGDGVSLAPVPFRADGSVNGEYLASYSTMASWTAGQCAANNVVLMHMPHPGDQFAEMNNGADLRALTGYSYANLLAAYKATIDVGAAAAATVNKPYEYPLSGCGPLTGNFPLGPDVGAYIGAKSGFGAYVQANGATIQSWGFGLWGTTVQATEVAARAGFVTTVRHGAQSINPGDYNNWSQQFAGLYALRCEYFEVYTNTGNGDGSHVGQTSFSGPNSGTLATLATQYNSYTAARAVQTH